MKKHYFSPSRLIGRSERENRDLYFGIQSSTLAGLLLAAVFTVFAPATRAQAPIVPPGEKEPLVRLEAGGPTSFVTSLAFSPDGKLLYVGGWDKVVRVWKLNERGEFVLTPASYRVPIGPGLNGAINCIALSPDGTLLAVAGSGVYRELAGFRQPGWVVPSVGGMTGDMRRDQGMIYVFDTRTQAVRLLRGHLGIVLAMAFTQAKGDAPSVLVSAARERNEDANKYEGVLRAWNPGTGEYLDGIREQPATNVRPGLVAWRTGPAIKDILVGIAWGDGFLKVWNLGEGKPWSSEKDREQNIGLVRLPDSGNLISTSFDYEKNKKSDGVATMWSFSPDSGLKLDGPRATLPFEGQSTIIPRAIAVVPAPPTGKVNHVALISGVYPPDVKEYEYRLRLLDAGSLQRIEGLADVSLWVSADTPALAASSQGYLAVAGNKNHTVHVYSVQNLLNNQIKPQILHSVGATFHYVTFVSKGKELGLLLSEASKKKMGPATREPQQGDLIFDFTKRPLAGDIREWQSAAPAADGWRARLAVADGQAVLPIYQGQDLIREVRIPKGMTVTDYALLPPRPPFNVPILAVAYHEIGQPWLALFDARTGEQIRQFTGHVDKISCLAFSPDGRLLASVAEDQTVCVWSLTNLDKILGKVGMLIGVAVRDQKGAVVVGSAKIAA